LRLRSPLAALALGSIAAYQRHLSPRKGYCCALHASGGGRSCSAYGYRAIARAGLVKGLVLLRRRFDACARAGRTAGAGRPVVRYRSGLAYQRGFCDCGGCDIPTCGPDAGDALSCLGDACSCDWPWKRRKSSERETNVDDHLNNEDALRERIRQAREARRQQ